MTTGVSAARVLLQRASEVKAAPAKTAPPDLAKVATPAPGASPVGAFAFMAGEDGTQAWIVKSGDADPVGYLRDAAQPDRAVQVTDPEAWVQIVDDLGLTEQPVPTEDAATPAPDPAAQAAPADAATPPADQTPPTPAPPAPPAPPEGKAAPGGRVVTPADQEEQTGIMVALMVPEGDAADLALDLPTALPPSELHLTLAFLGTTDEVTDEGAFYAKVLEALREVAAQFQPVTGQVSGVGRFSIKGDADAFYLSYDSPDLPELRQAVVEALTEVGLEPSREHGFTPHITLAYLKEGEENPVRRANTTVLGFDALSFCYGDQCVDIPLGSDDPAEGDAAMYAADTGIYPETTAPSAMVDAKAKTPPPITTGSFVSWSGGRGRVDLVVTNGKVPGVTVDVEGTASSPAARVVVYEQTAGKWKATGKKYAAKIATLKRMPPFAFGQKALDPQAGLVDVLTGYYEAHTAGPVVDPLAVKAVYDRGLRTWPGEQWQASREEWALGRTKAFLTVAAGGAVPGYHADRDLLPDGHPHAVKAAPMLTVEHADPVEPEGKAVEPIADGAILDAALVEDTLASLRAVLQRS